MSVVEPMRYHRHRSLLSESGWRRLRDIPVVVAGAGGLGSHVLESLVRLAPRRIEIWDPGRLDEPDLNRQILYAEADLTHAKVTAAVARLAAVNSEVEYFPVDGAIDLDRFAEASMVGRDNTAFALFDCLDSFKARAGLEQIRQKYGCTVFHGGVEGWFGQATTLLGSGSGYPHVFGPEYADIPKAAKPIFVQTVATIASFQVAEYVHWCENPTQTPLSSSLILYDGMSMRIDRIEIQ